MKQKQVWRYWCEFCNKAGLQKAHMAQHEAHCTLNPHRECRVCKMVQDLPEGGTIERRDPVALAAMLPDPASYTECDENVQTFTWVSERIREPLAVAMAQVRKACDGCPACILAALRLRGIPVPMADHIFNFTAEMKSILNDINDSRADEMDRY